MAQNRTQTNIFKGDKDGHVTANGKPLRLSTRGRKSSPTGFAWGYGGSGPFALAHSMLKHLFGEVLADQHATAFKFDVIAHLNPDESFELPYADVRAWMQKRSWSLAASPSLAALPLTSDDAPFDEVIENEGDAYYDWQVDGEAAPELQPHSGLVPDEGYIDIPGAPGYTHVMYDTGMDWDAVPDDDDEPADEVVDMGAVMFLSFEEAEFMRQVCSFDGLIVYPHQVQAMAMADKLEQGGLVTVDRAGPFAVVSAVRPPDGEE